YPADLPLEWAAGAVAEAYVALGDLDAAAAASLSFGVRPDRWLRVRLPAGSVESSGLVTAALDELMGGGALPRYVVSRRALAEGAGRFARFCKVWHPVPAELARRKDRAEAFLVAWTRWCGPARLVYAHDDAEGPRLA